jgi:hypothetical protein
VAGNDTLVLGSGGAAEHTIEFADFSMNGLGSNTGSGIRIPANSPNPPSNFRVKRVTIANYGGRGIYDQAGVFNSIFEGVQIDNCGSHQFDILCSNTVVFLNCYAQRVPTTGKAGYRVHGAQPVFIGCTGINSGEYWGIFGDTVAEDGVLGYCQPQLIGCDMESFTVCGLKNKTGSVILQNTSIIVAAGTVIGVQVDGANNAGWIDRYDSTFQAVGGGAWTNGFPIHQITTGNMPFIHINRASSPVVTFWNDADAASHNMTADCQALISTNRYAKQFQDLYLLGIFRNAYSGTATFAAATTSAVTFGTNQPDGTYGVSLSQSATSASPPWITVKTVSGFTINFGANFTGSVDWFVYRIG